MGNYTYIPKDKLPACWHDINRDKDGGRIKAEKLGILLWKEDVEPEFNPDIITKIE